MQIGPRGGGLILFRLMQRPFVDELTLAQLI